ncbi:MAG: Holliday junction resolvase RuvX [Phycisphaeraceae bacterium]|nr:Holliday junction resolvase RuvX [Phycisphaeraceae bacterium]
MDASPWTMCDNRAVRVLAIDLGDRRTGFALGDRGSGIIRPAGVIEAPTAALRQAAILAAVRREGPDSIVIGLPLNMDGSEGPAAAAARREGAAIAAATGLPVAFQDERLTSFAADQAMAQSGRTRAGKKRLRDALAAAEILRDHFERGGPAA